MSQTYTLEVKGFLSTEFDGATRFAYLGAEGTIEQLVDDVLEFYRDHYKVFAMYKGGVEVDKALAGDREGMLVVEGDPEVYGQTVDILVQVSGCPGVVNEVLTSVAVVLTGF